MAFLLAKLTPHNVNHDNDRFSMFNKKRDIPVLAPCQERCINRTRKASATGRLLCLSRFGRAALDRNAHAKGAPARLGAAAVRGG